MKIKGMLVSGLALLGMVACSPKSGSVVRSTGDGIVGGTSVGPTDQIAQMTAILYDTEQSSLCTASVISDEWLLTAGHCVDGSTNDSLLVIFTNDINQLQQAQTPDQRAALKAMTRKVVAFTQNPGYAATMAKIDGLEKAAEANGSQLTPADIDNVKDWGDITLIHIDGKIPDGYKAATFLPSTYQFKKGDTVTLAGFGITSKDNSDSAGTLRQVDVTVAEPVWGTTEILFDQTNGKGACHGDSGGPAYVKNADGTLSLFGVTSRGVHDDSDSCVTYAAYTNMQFYRDWVKQVAGF